MTKFDPITCTWHLLHDADAAWVVCIWDSRGGSVIRPRQWLRRTASGGWAWGPELKRHQFPTREEAAAVATEVRVTLRVRSASWVRIDIRTDPAKKQPADGSASRVQIDVRTAHPIVQPTEPPADVFRRSADDRACSDEARASRLEACMRAGTRWPVPRNCGRPECGGRAR